MLMVLMVAWYFGTSRVEGLDQSTWVHHLVVVQFRALFILIMVIIRVISILLSPVFSSSELFLFCWVRFWFRLVVYSSCLESDHLWSFFVLHMMYSLVHLVIQSFILSMRHFSHECVLHILCWCAFMLLIWDILFTIHYDHLGLTYHGGYWAYWPRIRRSISELETMTRFIFWSEQHHIHIHTLTF